VEELEAKKEEIVRRICLRSFQWAPLTLGKQSHEYGHLPLGNELYIRMIVDYNPEGETDFNYTFIHDNGID
jgi:hypothetical protein